MKYDELILACIECIKSFNGNKEGPDSHSETFLKNVYKDFSIKFTNLFFN
jgi:hypothetical protein